MTTAQHENVLALIREYHVKYHPDQVDMTPATATEELVRFRQMLYEEEIEEARTEFLATIEGAEDNGGVTRPDDIAYLMHELADVVIVAYGTAMRLGIDLDRVMLAVISAGFQKLPPETPGGKATKGEGYVSPLGEVQKIVGEAS